MRSIKYRKTQWLDESEILAIAMKHMYPDQSVVLVRNAPRALANIPELIMLKRDAFSVWERAHRKQYMIRQFNSLREAKDWAYSIPPDKGIIWEIWDQGELWKEEIKDG
jgi:hypothetical protein